MEVSYHIILLEIDLEVGVFQIELLVDLEAQPVDGTTGGQSNDLHLFGFKQLHNQIDRGCREEVE